MFGSGGGGPQTIYAAPFAMGLCDWDGNALNPVKVLKVWKGKNKSTLKKLNATLFSPTTNPASGWGWLLTNHPDEYLAYSNLVYVASPLVLLDDNAQIPNLSFEVQAMACCLSGQTDADPYSVIDDFLNNQYYGVTTFQANQYSNYKLPLATCSQFKNYTRACGLFISPVLSEQKSAADWLSEFAKCTNSEFVFNGAALEIIPFGDEAATGNGATFAPDISPLFDFTDDDYILSGDSPEDPVVCTTKSPAECYNYVQVEYVNRGNDYNIDIAQSFDQADIERRGKIPMDVVKLHEICEPYVAYQVVELLKYRALHIKRVYTFNVGWKYLDLIRPMDLVTITDAKLGLNQLLVRVLTITEQGDNGYSIIEAEENPLGIGSANQYAHQIIKPYAPDTGVDPGLINTPVIFQAPSVLATNNPEVWMAVSGADENWGGCHVWASLDGDNYQQIGTITTKAKMGVSTATFASGTDPDTVHTLAVDLTESLGELNGGTQTNADDFQTLSWIGGELIAYQDATLTDPNKYNLGTYIRRGCYGTSISSHASNSVFARLDDNIFKYSFPIDYVGKLVYLKFTSFNIFGQAEEDIGDVAEYTITIVGGLWPSKITGVMVAMANTDNNLNTAEIIVSWDDPPGTDNVTDYAVVVTPIGDQVLGGNDGLNYTCKLQHTSAADNRPGMSPPTANFATYWTQEGTAGVPWVLGKLYTTEPYTGASQGLQTGSPGRAAALIVSADEPAHPLSGTLWVRK